MQPPARPPLAVAAVLAAALLAGAACRAADIALAAAPPASAQSAKPSVSSAQSTARPGPPRVAQPARVEASPLWKDLTPLHQKALAPLASTWAGLSEPHKRKWLAVSTNFPTMPPGEQARLHSRMAGWAALSPQQRSQARLNFAETQALPQDDKKAKWEVYQALPAEEKRKLAAGAVAAKPPAPSTAAALQPVPQQKLAKVPKAKKTDSRSPAIAVAPNQLDHNTLLPQPGALANQP
jgi:hypothetical protein